MSNLKVIVKSGRKSWEGKFFSISQPCKIYSNIDEALTALNSYHFWKYSENTGSFEQVEKSHKIEIIFINECKLKKLLEAGKIRW